MRLTTLRRVGLEGASHTIQLGIFPSVKEVRTNPYHTILINMYGFVFLDQPIPYDFYESIWSVSNSQTFLES